MSDSSKELEQIGIVDGAGGGFHELFLAFLVSKPQYNHSELMSSLSQHVWAASHLPNTPKESIHLIFKYD